MVTESQAAAALEPEAPLGWDYYGEPIRWWEPAAAPAPEAETERMHRAIAVMRAAGCCFMCAMDFAVGPGTVRPCTMTCARVVLDRSRPPTVMQGGRR